jgi:hypothetical protein
MRFPIDPPPPVGVTEDPYEIQEKAAVSPIRPVAEPRAQQLVMPRRHAPAPPREQEREVPTADRRAGEDRRKVDRRVSNQPVLVDTRSGIDRRRNKRREDDPTTRIDEKA